MATPRSHRKRPERPSERVRQPPPVLKRRIPSGRGATEQPNVTSEQVPLTTRFWALVVATGVATGLAGAGLMWLLFSVEHLAFGGHQRGFEAAVEHSSDARRVVVLLVAGVIGGVAWYVLRRATPGEPSEVDEALWNGDGRLSFRRCAGTSVISEVVIGMGASIGREAAPKLMGGAFGSVLGTRFGLSPTQLRLLVACGAGAGLGAVYNVPLGGALFTAEVLIGSISLPVILPALLCSLVATAASWVYLPNHATYLALPTYHSTAGLVVWSVPAGLVIGLVAVGYLRLIAWVSHHRMKGWWAIGAPVVAFGILGVIGIQYPQLFGNGKDMAHDAFVGALGLGTLAALWVLKPLVTSLCLGAGASGGLFTPVMSTGAMLGGTLGLLWTHVWSGAGTEGAFAVVGAAAMIGAGMQAPLAGLLLVLELTHTDFSILVPMGVATVIATVVARHIDGYSIYSARLPG